MYYYFFRNQEVVKLSFEVVAQDTRYVALTTKQVNFYKKHPTASIHEIKNCKMDDPEPPVDIEQLKTNAIKELSQYSLSTIEKYCTPYQFANAQSSLMVIDEGGIGIYDETTAKQYIDIYNYYGKQCRDLFYEAKDHINLCATTSEIDEIVNEYKDHYDHLDDNE